MPSPPTRIVPLLVLCAAFVAGCGGSSATQTRTTERGDRVEVRVNSYRVSLSESGSGSFHFPGAPEMDHDGALGCAGQYFDIQAQMAFRYTAHNAKLIYGRHLYSFGEPPHRRQGFLVWSAKIGGDRVEARVHCPLPRG